LVEQLAVVVIEISAFFVDLPKLAPVIQADLLESGDLNLGALEQLLQNVSAKKYLIAI
jgi:hypothetical protein